MDCPRNNLALITLDADAWRLREHQLALITSDSRCCSTTSNNIDYSRNKMALITSNSDAWRLREHQLALITSAQRMRRRLGGWKTSGARTPTAWTMFQQDGPNHLGLWCNMDYLPTRWP